MSEMKKEEAKDCPKCKGTGRGHFFTNIPGVGKIKDPIHGCGNCNGTGRVPLDRKE